LDALCDVPVAVGDGELRLPIELWKPGEAVAMWSGHSNRHLVVGEDEPALRSRIHVGATDDAGHLVRYPVNVAGSFHSAHDVGEPIALLLIQVGQHCGVEDNQGCI
jgi:hypothetical protein